MRQAFPSGVVLRAAVTDEGKPANFPRTFVSRTSLRDSAHTVVAIPRMLWMSPHQRGGLKIDGIATPVC